MAESGDAESLDLRASAIAAVDAAENSIKTKTPRIETVITPGIPGAHVTGSVPSVATSIGPSSADTELSAELSSFPEGVTGIKLVTLQAASAVADVTSVISPISSGTAHHMTHHHMTSLHITPSTMTYVRQLAILVNMDCVYRFSLSDSTV